MPEAEPVAAPAPAPSTERELTREQKMQRAFNNPEMATFAQRKARTQPAPPPQLIRMGSDNVMVTVGGIRDQHVEEMEVILYVEKGHSSRRWVQYPGQEPTPLFDNTSRTETVTRLRPGQLRRPGNKFRNPSPQDGPSQPV